VARELHPMYQGMSVKTLMAVQSNLIEYMDRLRGVEFQDRESYDYYQRQLESYQSDYDKIGELIKSKESLRNGKN
jgi:hypothetical protein